MHIGFVTLESPFDAARGGGIASYLRAMIPSLLKLGHRVSLFANGEGEAPEEKNLHVYSFKLPGFHSLLERVPVLRAFLTHPVRQMEWSKKFYSEILKVHQKNPLDIIECSEAGGGLLHRIGPYIVRLHGNEYVFRKYTGQSIDPGLRINHCLEKKIFERAAAVTAPSSFHAGEVARSFGWPAEKIQTIFNPVAEPVLKEALRHTPPDGNPKSPVILYAGRLAPVKGVQTLFEAIPQVLKKFPDAQFVFAGPWQMSKSPEHYGFNKNGRARWLGHVSWQKLIAEEYPRAHLFIMPSYYETFNIACLEAMAFGLPVVAAKTGGIPEVIEDGITGVLVPPGNPAALAEAVNRLLSDSELRQALGKAGRKRAQQFSAEKIASQTAALYERVLRK